jgi:hypothetical protein
MTTLATTRRTPGWYIADDGSLTDFRAVVETTTNLTEYPYADEVRENVLVYGARLGNHVATPRWAPGRSGRARPRARRRAAHRGPIGGLAPETQAELVWRALQETWAPDALDAELTAQDERHTSAL